MKKQLVRAAEPKKETKFISTHEIRNFSIAVFKDVIQQSQKFGQR